MNMNPNEEYGAGKIQVLEGLEAVRKRPGMYIGSTDERGLHHLVMEIVDNSIDEAMAGRCDEIFVEILEDGKVLVRDNGSGIPTGMHPTMGRPAVEVCLTVLHAGGKFGGGAYQVSGGLHGVGLSVVNALSSWLKVIVHQNGHVYEQEYERGTPLNDLHITGDADDTGTTIIFMADDQVFETLTYNYTTIRTRLRELAFLNKGVTIHLKDDREGSKNEETFIFEGGIMSYVEYLNRSKETIFEKPVRIYGERGDAFVEIALQYNDTYSENIYTYANNIATSEGGTHLEGFRNALTRIVNDYARRKGYLKASDENLSGEDIREGICAVISVKLLEPQFEGQTKTKLGNSEIRALVSKAMTDDFTAFLEENPIPAKALIDKCVLSSRARIAARKAREVVRKSSVMRGGGLPGKLTDCSDKNPENCEIFIVEGLSAGGSAKDARDSHYQAILPLRGKILNVEKTRLDKMLGNAEIKAMIASFGAGIGEDFDIEKLRYHKIICMTDADVDGSHIRTLLLTFFYRYMRPLIEHGYVYIAMPPLYRLVKGKQERYVFSDAELEAAQEEMGRDGITMSRFKGLGEMNARQLRDTTMDPKTRTMMRVSLQDAMSADMIFDLLMGERVEPRRMFIEENAKLVADLDI